MHISATTLAALLAISLLAPEVAVALILGILIGQTSHA